LSFQLTVTFAGPAVLPAVNAGLLLPATAVGVNPPAVQLSEPPV